MSEVKRFDPRRTYRMTPTGLRRIVLGEIGVGDPQVNGAQRSRVTQVKPLRTNQPATRWHMAIAHSYRGRLDEHAREAIAAAAIIATPRPASLPSFSANSTRMRRRWEPIRSP